MSQLRITSRNVINQGIHKNIEDVLRETITTIGIRWDSSTHRTSFVEVIEEYFEELIEQGLIERFKVICDYRNNPKGFRTTNEYVFEVQYHQPHCLNPTTLTFHIPKK